MIASIQGRVFEGFIPREKVAVVNSIMEVASAVVSGESGDYRVRLLADSAGATPPEGFTATEATLEDGYFATGLQLRAAAHGAA